MVVHSVCNNGSTQSTATDCIQHIIFATEPLTAKRFNGITHLVCFNGNRKCIDVEPAIAIP